MSKHSIKDMGKRIQLRRKHMGIKQYDLTERLGISNNRLSAIENGTKKNSFDIKIQSIYYGYHTLK